MNKRIKKKYDKNDYDFVKFMGKGFLTTRILIKHGHHKDFNLNRINIKRACSHVVRHMSYPNLMSFVISVLNPSRQAYFSMKHLLPVNGEISDKNVLKQIGVLSETLNIPIVTADQDFRRGRLHSQKEPQ